MENITQQLIRHEGVRLKPYKDSVGKLTIGIGRNLDDVGITENEAMTMLRNDVIRCEIEVIDNVQFFSLLDQVRRDVLTNMCFNMGIVRLLGFKKMLHALSQCDHVKASEEMLDSKWARQVGIRATELVYQMKTGKYKEVL